MAEIKLGSIVLSKAGKDKGLFLAAIKLDGQYAWLADGGLRPALKPKLKKLKHIQPTSHLIEGIDTILKSQSADAQLRKILGRFNNPKNTEGEYFE